MSSLHRKMSTAMIHSIMGRYLNLVKGMICAGAGAVGGATFLTGSNNIYRIVRKFLNNIQLSISLKIKSTMTIKVD
jgi:hypothetical protein